MCYRTIKPVKSGEELLIWYGAEYAQELGIIVEPDKKKVHTFMKNRSHMVYFTKALNSS